MMPQSPPHMVRKECHLNACFIFSCLFKLINEYSSYFVTNKYRVEHIYLVKLSFTFPFDVADYKIPFEMPVYFFGKTLSLLCNKQHQSHETFFFFFENGFWNNSEANTYRSKQEKKILYTFSHFVLILANKLHVGL